MHDIKRIRKNPQEFKDHMTSRGTSIDVDYILKLDKELRGSKHSSEKLREDHNKKSKIIGQIMIRVKKMEKLDKEIIQLNKSVGVDQLACLFKSNLKYLNGDN